MSNPSGRAREVRLDRRFAACSHRLPDDRLKEEAGQVGVTLSADIPKEAARQIINLAMGGKLPIPGVLNRIKELYNQLDARDGTVRTRVDPKTQGEALALLGELRRDLGVSTTNRRLP